MSTTTPRNRLDSVMELIRAGRNAEAKASLLRLLKQSPRDRSLLSAMVAALSALGEFDTALYYANRAAEVSPGVPGVLANRARVHILARRFEDALTDLRGELQIDPINIDVRITMSQILSSVNRLDEALDVLDDPRVKDLPGSRLSEARAAVLLNLGEADEALRIEKEIIPRDPGNPAVAERAANAAIYATGSSPAEIKELASRYGRLVSVRTPVARAPFANTPDPDRRIRIGFIGGDFRDHASMRFFEPLARAYDRSRLDIRCYMTLPSEDAVSSVIRGLVDHFEPVHALRTIDLAARLRGDGLDVLVDLSGRTMGHRLECFHHRPAPVQMTWYGQPSTTGLSAIDYRIVDSYTDPAGTESHNVERLLRLDPCGFAYGPPAGVPDVQPPPSQHPESPTRGVITFGSYNNLTKLNEATFSLWARVLDAVPASRLIMRHTAFASPGVRDRTLERMVRAGFGNGAASRVQIVGPVSGPLATMAEYHHVDIALDSTPYGGMTTTCEATYMGVPVVSLATDRSVSRHTVSILSNCGLADLIAHTPEDYVRIAVGLANDPVRLRQIRASARSRMEAVVCNGADFARRFESGIRSAWREWCANGRSTN